LPFGLIAVYNKNITLYNKECEKIIGGEPTLQSFESFKENGSERTIRFYLENTDKLIDTEQAKFTFHNPNISPRVMHFEVSYSHAILNNQMNTIIILHDHTVFEELKTVEEKYQRLYFASVVHDIRTPLNGILGMLEIIDQSTRNAKGLDLEKYIRVAKNSAKLLMFLTYDVTDYSQMEAKILKINKQNFNIAVTVNECLDLMEFNFSRKGLILSKSIDEIVPTNIWSDKTRYTQILLNLLGNALKFTTQGSVNVHVSYDNKKDLLITNVKDTGIGIKSEDIPKLFKLFGRITHDSHLALNPNGVGLGLSICKKLSEHLGGSITVTSKENGGSTFSFTIKANCENESDIPDEKMIEALSSPHCSMKLPQFRTDKQLRILIVDDNDSNIFVLQNFAKINKNIKYDIVFFLVK